MQHKTTKCRSNPTLKTPIAARYRHVQPVTVEHHKITRQTFTDMSSRSSGHRQIPQDEISPYSITQKGLIDKAIESEDLTFSEAIKDNDDNINEDDDSDILMMVI